MNIQLDRLTAPALAKGFVLFALVCVGSFYQANGVELDHRMQSRAPGQHADLACSSTPVTSCSGLACKVQADAC